MSVTTTKKSSQLSEIDLTSEQQAAITRLYEHDSTLLIAGLGFGKAVVGLTAAQEILASGHVKRVLVLAPLSVATLTWGPEADKWSHITEPVAVACGTEKQRRAAIESGARIVVSNFDCVAWLIKEYGKCFDAMLVDELTKLKTSGGAWVKALRGWSKKLVWRVGMTGTPVAECGEDLYSQALLLDGGKALGTRKDAFLERFFYPTDYMRYNWALKPGAEVAMGEALRGLVYIADDSGYKAALPELSTELVTVGLDDAGREVYSAMAADAVWGEVIAENAAVQKGKLQQIAAGGLYLDDKSLAWSSCHKEEALAALVDRLAEPVIVVYNYLFERAWLMDLYPDAPVIGGGDKVSPDTIAAFNRGEIQVLLMHWRSGSHGLNLQGACRYMIHTSPLWSADGWLQTIGRIHRRGQMLPCTRFVLVTEGTVETDTMLPRIDKKRSAELSLMTALAC